MLASEYVLNFTMWFSVLKQKTYFSVAKIFSSLWQMNPLSITLTQQRMDLMLQTLQITPKIPF